ncbi:hypothetical protein ACROYT_G003640 [Oculina patagonica]
MLVGKVWFFVVVAVSLATDVSSKQSPGVGGNLSRRQELEQKLSIHSVGTPVYQVSSKQSALNGPNNENEFSGNWTNPIDSKWYSKPSEKIGLHFAGLSQERSQDVFKKMVGLSFSKKLFEIALRLELPERALNTKFVQGMAEGLLLPSEFGGFMVQDIAYLAHVAKMYEEAAKKMEEQGKNDFALFFLGRQQRYGDDLRQSLETWRLESDACVKKGLAVEMYMGYQRKVVKEYPKYLPIATLPCSMLWPWIAGNLIGKVDKQNPYYKEWFLMNLRQPGQIGKTEKFVDDNFNEEDEETALNLFCQGLMMEANFFREAGGEGLIMFDDQYCRKLISEILSLH